MLLRALRCSQRLLFTYLRCALVSCVQPNYVMFAQTLVVFGFRK